MLSKTMRLRKIRFAINNSRHCMFGNSLCIIISSNGAYILDFEPYNMGLTAAFDMGYGFFYLNQNYFVVYLVAIAFLRET